MTGGQPLPALAVRRGSPFHRQVMETEKGEGASPPKVSLSPYSIVKRKTTGSQSRPRGLVPQGGAEAALCAHPGSPDTPAPSAASQSLSGGSPGRHPLGTVHTLPEHRLRQKQRDTERLQILVVHGKLERELCLLRRHRRGTRPQRLMRSFWKRRGRGRRPEKAPPAPAASPSRLRAPWLLGLHHLFVGRRGRVAVGRRWWIGRASQGRAGLDLEGHGHGVPGRIHPGSSGVRVVQQSRLLGS